MKEPQRLYLVQARTDWKLYGLLVDEAVCHRLHYLQMCAEKLSKAYFWRGSGAAALGHAAFTKFLRCIGTNPRVAQHFRFAEVDHFREWIKDISDLAYEIERLVPALAGSGPNPEYPWPRESPLHAPVEHRFPLWNRLGTREGKDLLRVIKELIDQFETIFSRERSELPPLH